MRFRKSVKLGPVRLTAGKKSGSVSIGGAGMRLTKSTSGRTTKSVGIPGTGLGWTSSKSGGKKKQMTRQATPAVRPATTAAAGLKPTPTLTPAQLAQRRRLNSRILLILGGAVLVIVLLAALL